MDPIFTILERKSYILQWRFWKPDPKRYAGNSVLDFSFKDKMKEAKMQPRKIMMYGLNTFACDDKVRKILIKSVKLPSITLFDYDDIVSYKLTKDGTVLAGKPVDGSGETSGYNASTDENGVLCSALSLTIETKNPTHKSVEMPFIYFTEKSENVYRQALDAAWEIANSLDKII